MANRIKGNVYWRSVLHKSAANGTEVYQVREILKSLIWLAKTNKSLRQHDPKHGLIWTSIISTLWSKWGDKKSVFRYDNVIKQHENWSVLDAFRFTAFGDILMSLNLGCVYHTKPTFFRRFLNYVWSKKSSRIRNLMLWNTFLFVGTTEIFCFLRHNKKKIDLEPRKNPLVCGKNTDHHHSTSQCHNPKWYRRKSGMKD